MTYNRKFETLKAAVIQHREIRIVYESAGSGQSRRTVQPLKLSYKSKEWYLKAFCLERQDFRLFKLNRILDLELLEGTFVPRPCPKEPPPLPCARIVLRFPGEMAYRVYDEFDGTEITRHQDGSLTVSTELPADSWLVGYLLSYGAQVEVLEPARLREVLAARAREIYEKNQ